MAHEQDLPALAALLAVDAKGIQLVGQRFLDSLAQLLQGGNHFLPAGKLASTGISPEFPLPTEPEHDHAGQDSKHYLGHYGGHKKTDPMPFLVLQDHPVYKMANHSG